ncbi:MAG: SUMF1/EgtB/PvdO family nonheme iron enzyme [Cyanobacteria bacterium P01_F01_bin.143]
MSEIQPTPRQKLIQKIIKYGGFSGTGIGGAAILGFLLQGQFKAAAISVLLTVAVTGIAIAYKFVSGVTNRVFDKIEEELDNLEEPIAQWIVNLPKRFFTWIWCGKTNSQFQNQCYESLIDTFRELKIEGFRIGLPVLDLENVFVSLQVAPEIPEKATGSMIRRQDKTGNQEIWNFLNQSTKKEFQAFRRLAVIGPPGSGKTTLLKHLTLIYAKKQSKVYNAPKLIPILLYLRDIRQLIVTEPRPNLPQLIRQHIQSLPATERLNPPANWIEDKLKMGKFLVMLDGLDEVADFQERTQVSQWVNQQIQNYRKNLFILTSRPHGYRSAPVEQVGTVLEALPFNSGQVKQFIQSWYLQTEIMSRAGRDTPAVRAEASGNAEDLIKRIMDNRAIADMAKNPLLVTMIATVHYCGSALPGRRVELYQRICDLLLGSRQEAKKIKTSLTGEQNKSVLQVLALALMQLKIREFKPIQGEELIAEELQRVAGGALTPAQFLKQIKEVSGLLVERELGVYEFAHLSFQEYLAAAQVKELQQDNILTKNIQDPWWAETIRLYAAQSDASKLINVALEEITITALKLALDCQEEALRIQPEVRQQLTEKLDKGLESSELEVFELAAEVKLAKRLSRFFRINEEQAIDTSNLTWAEYQLFVNELGKSELEFPGIKAKQPAIIEDWQDALDFCEWLSEKSNLIANLLSEDKHYYRIPKQAEIEKYLGSEARRLKCWAFGADTVGKQDLRLVQTKTPNIFGFKVITVNSQGKEIRSQLCCAKYFTEELGNRINLDMVAIPGGKFLMGTDNQEIERLFKKFRWEGFRREKPQHEVIVQPFSMGKYPITQAQYQKVMGESHSYFKGDDRPVEQVSWDKAKEFCRKLSQLTGKEYRLPTEAEWEYACRSVISPKGYRSAYYQSSVNSQEWNDKYHQPFHFGETITSNLANYDTSNTYANEPKGEYRGRTTPVGIFPPNAFGLYDMHGNVWEWCEDDWHGSYQNAPKDGTAWLEDVHSNRISAGQFSLKKMSRNLIDRLLKRESLSKNSNIKVVRGGSWFLDPDNCRSASRTYFSRDSRSYSLGFRVVCVAPRTT